MKTAFSSPKPKRPPSVVFESSRNTVHLRGHDEDIIDHDHHHVGEERRLREQRIELHKANVKKQNGMIEKLANKKLSVFKSKPTMKDEAIAAIMAITEHINREYYSDIINNNNYSILNEFPSIELAKTFNIGGVTCNYYSDSASIVSESSERSSFSGSFGTGFSSQSKSKKKMTKAGAALEKAIRRGSTLGRSEDSERPIQHQSRYNNTATSPPPSTPATAAVDTPATARLRNNSISDDVSELDSTIITEDVTRYTAKSQLSTGSGRSKSKKDRTGHTKKRKAGQKSKKNGASNRKPFSSDSSYRSGRSALTKNSLKNTFESLLSDQMTNDAWMCGVCGKAFITLAAAEKHEDQHIKDIIKGFGWIGDSRSGFLTVPKIIVGANADADNGHASAGGGKGSFSADTGAMQATQNIAGAPIPLDHQMSNLSNQSNSSARHQRDNYTTPPRDNYTQHSSLLGPRPAAMLSIQEEKECDLLLSNTMKEAIVLADEALVEVCGKASNLMLTQNEIEAERELLLLSKDKIYYDGIISNVIKHKQLTKNGKYNRSEGKTLLSKVQNKLVDAYQLMKEGDATTNWFLSDDLYMKKNRKGTDDEMDAVFMEHSNKTLYVNVMVRNSIQVVNHELTRLAKQKWEHTMSNNIDQNATQFEKFRALAHGNLVKLAGLALASDFTPRRIAKQLSNELYQLLKPRMRRRGVRIITEIEYRVGPYFVLSVNIANIDWGRLLKSTNKEVRMRNLRWRQQKKLQKEKSMRKVKGDEYSEMLEPVDKKSKDDDKNQKKLTNKIYRWYEEFSNSIRMTKFDVLAQVLALLYYTHWIFYFPICFFWYNTFLGSTIRAFIISTVIDEIFFYVEEKGMEMEIEVRKASYQASFMLSALRELRIDDQKLKKKRQDAESEAVGEILGPLLGPAIKQDKAPAAAPPPGFIMPNNLETIGLEIDLPVGYRRLRWALLNSESEFVKEAVFRTGAKFDKITFGPWSKHDDTIGAPVTPDEVGDEGFLGAEKEISYLMPKSAFVSANMCYETFIIEAYNDYVFCLKKKALTPDVPYGKTFIAWTQYIVVNNGNDTCRLICSVEAEFPNGPPMVSRQIISGMRAGCAEIFVLLGETIGRYADQYPK